MGLGLKCRNSQNYVSAYASSSTSAWKYQNVCHRGTKKIVVAPTTFSPVKDRFPFPGIHYRCSLRQRRIGCKCLKSAYNSQMAPIHSSSFNRVMPQFCTLLI